MCAKHGLAADAHDGAAFAASVAPPPAPSLAASSTCSAGGTTATRSACFVGPSVGLVLGAAVGQYVTIVRRSECEDSEQPFAIKAARCEFTHVAHSPDTPPAFASPHHESSASAHVYVGAPVGASDGGIVGAFVSPSTVGLDVGDAVGAVGASVGSTVGLDVAQYATI